MYYDRVANELVELLPGDLVPIQLQKSKLRKRKEWTLARVEGKVTKDGRVYRGNRRHVRHTRKTTCDSKFEMVLPSRLKPNSRDSPATCGISESQDLPHAAPVQ